MELYPVFDYPHYTEEVTIDDMLYILTFSWNSRGSFWTMAVDDRDGNNIVSGLKLMVGVDVFERFHRRTLPGGVNNIPLADNGSLVPILEGDIGKHINIFHIVEADLAV
jgi:hypothetical protein